MKTSSNPWVSPRIPIQHEKPFWVMKNYNWALLFWKIVRGERVPTILALHTWAGPLSLRHWGAASATARPVEKMVRPTRGRRTICSKSVKRDQWAALLGQSSSTRSRGRVIADFELFTVPGLDPFTGEVRRPVRGRDDDEPFSGSGNPRTTLGFWWVFLPTGGGWSLRWA